MAEMNPEQTIEEFAKFIVTADETFQSIADEFHGEGGIYARLERLEAAPPKQAGQPDWFMCTDPATAASWLEAIGFYSNRVLKYVVGGGPSLTLAPCWPWHPRVVAELLASMCHYRMAHQSPIPNHVSDMWGRWFTGPIGRINKLLDACYLNHKEEYTDAATGLVFREWNVDLDQLPAYLTWWCTTERDGIPPGLRRKT